MAVAIDACHQRTEFAASGFPPPQHDFMSGPALGLGPVLRTPGAIGRIELLRDDALKRQLAGRLQDGVTATLEMFDITDLPGLGLRSSFQQFLQALFTFGERQRANILAVDKQEIEDKEDQPAGITIRKCGLQRREVRRPVMIQRNDLAVDQHIRQCTCLLGDAGKLPGPVQPLAGLERGFAVLDAQLHAVAIELDFMGPAIPTGRALDGSAKLGRDKIRNRIDLPGLCRRLCLCFRFGRRPRSLRRGLAFRAGFCRFTAIRMPDRVSLATAVPGQHEGFRRPSLAFRDLPH